METEFYFDLRARLALLWLLPIVIALLATSGCALVGSRNAWNAPAPYSPNSILGTTDPCLAGAETQYLAGEQAAASGNPTCLDYYYNAAVQSWPYHVATATQPDSRATALYQTSVRQFIESAVCLGRFDRNRGITLGSGLVVPVHYQCFVWQPADFCSFLPVGNYQSQRLSHHYVSTGVGVPYVVLTTNPPRRPFTNVEQPFAATAVVAPTAALGGGFGLAFYDPLRTTTTDAGQPIARDLSAPIGYAASQESDAWLDDFLRPDRGDTRDGLHMREPFQPGKIPVVFVHGLASDPLTWAQLENDLRAQPAIFARYQFWFFRYDTGDPFLSSAAKLRQQLAAARQTYDPARADPNLSRMVLIGHSMGGLLSKMQVTYSGDTIWNAAATQPFNTIITDPMTRANLASAFFFTPSPDITRVVYIATPHQGSSTATRCVGRISSALVVDRPDWVARHEQLVRDNPCAFRPELERGIPTSIDLLEPQSGILQATNTISYNPVVKIHSILGDDRWTPIQGPADGVVAVSSARISGVQSELFVDAKHTEVQRHSETVREVIAILTTHAGSTY